MNYRFTAILILALTMLALFVEPAYPRNDYLNNGTNTCSTGDLSVSVEQRDSENRYRHYDSTNNYNSPSDDKSIRLTWRHYLGSACTDEFKAVQQENMELKQQLELMKMCGRVNSNPTLKHNPSFNLLVSKCVGVAPTGNNTRPNDSKSLWDDMKDDYKKENPDLTLMGDKIIGPSKSKLKIPPKDYILPLPKPKDE
ncbi:hypothetical protein OAV26_03125 [Crocinitomicaceae bacterium]|nr:hypothetical protein [Crocinitomicaceae bacterium]